MTINIAPKLFWLRVRHRVSSLRCTLRVNQIPKHMISGCISRQLLHAHVDACMGLLQGGGIAN